MVFDVPVAFWGLAAAALLVLLSLWRPAPRRVVVPGLALWKEVTDRIPPIRALRRPRSSSSLILQILALVSGVFALAGPRLESRPPAPRRVAVVIDLSARMAPRIDDVRAALGKVRGLLRGEDRLVVYTFPEPRRFEADPVLDAVHRAGDSAPALDLASRESDVLFFIGDRAVASPCRQILVGGPFANTGVIDAMIDGGRVFARVVGPDGERMMEFEPKAEIRVAEDGFPLDDVIYLDRRGTELRVALEGRPHAGLLRVLGRMAGVRLVRGGEADLVVRVGEGARPGDPPARVLVDPPGDGAVFKPATLSVPAHPLWRSVPVEEVRVSGAREVAGGEPVLFGDGRPVAAIRGRELHFGADVPEDGWPAMPSFPIFWSNVIECLVPGRPQEWMIRRTGGPVELADGRIVAPSRVGANTFGGETVHANLLDRRASDFSGGESRADLAPLEELPARPVRRDVAAWPAAAALVLALLSWFTEGRR